MKKLKLSEFKKIKEITGLSPLELESALDSGDWSLLTDDEAQEQATDYIKDSIWAFNASFLAHMLGCPTEAVEAIQINDACEDNNPVFLAWLSNTEYSIEDFAEAAISADGRGHFLSSYDGEEHEIGEFYLYRHN